MTLPAPDTQAAAWLAEGERAAGALDAVHSVLVLGRDTDAAAWIAIGLARAQSARRRVAIADMIGEVGPIEKLLRADDDDPHGIADSFLYGVSLNKIARPVDAGGRLFVLPSGSEPVAVEEIFRSERWTRLAGGFREVGALLILVAHADTPGLEALAAAVEGTVFAGDATGALPDAEPPLAVVGARSRPVVRPTIDDDLDEAGDEGATAGYAVFEPPDAVPAEVGVVTSTPIDGTPVVEHPRADAPASATPVSPTPPRRITPTVPLQPAGPKRWQVAAVVGLAAAALVAAVSLVRGRDRSGDAFVRLPSRDSAAVSAGNTARSPGDSAGEPVVRVDSARVDSATDAAAPRGEEPTLPVPSGPLPRLAVGNPSQADSAAAYAVYIKTATSRLGASVEAYADPNAIPAFAIYPVLLANDGNRVWYRTSAGAYTRRVQAESLLTALRQRGVVNAASGNVVRLPYALLLEDRVPAAMAPRRILALRDRGVTAYPLSRDDGTVALYAGAFETADEAALLAQTLRAAGLSPTLVYRIGRSL